jgi:hypothetical protein
MIADSTIAPFTRMFSCSARVPRQAGRRDQFPDAVEHFPLGRPGDPGHVG